jgi:hypothetical protein
MGVYAESLRPIGESSVELGRVSLRLKTISARQLWITFLPSFFILAAIGAVSAIYHVKMPYMTRDITAIAGIHPLTGVLSNLGVLLWCAAASICLFSALTIHHVASKDIFWFLFSSGFLSLYLLFDDFFQFHEDLAYRYLGLDEKVVYAVLGLAVFGYLIAFRRVILRTEYVFLLLAIGFLLSSVVIDAILQPWMWRLGHWEFFFEDGAKWLGIACWCSYYVQTGYQFSVSSFGLANDTIQSDVRASRAVVDHVLGARGRRNPEEKWDSDEQPHVFHARGM